MDSGGDALRSSTTLGEPELRDALVRLSSSLARGGVQTRNAAGVGEGRQTEDWKARRAALEQLQTFAAEDVASRAVFAQLVSSTIKVPLLEQLADKRSVIVRTACEVVKAFARHSTNRAVWASMCVWLLPPLLQLTASTTKAVARAAEEALQCIATSGGGFGAEALGELLKISRARHASVRLHALKTLLTLLHETKGTTQQMHLARFAVPVSRVIAAGVADAEGRVRKTARQCYWGLRAMEPEAAARLYSTCEPSTRALLEREKHDALRVVGTVEAAETDTSLAQTHGRPSAATSLATSRRAGGDRGKDRLPASDALALRDDLQAVAAERSRASSATAPRVVRQREPNSPSPAREKSTNVTTASPARMTPIAQVTDGEAAGSSNRNTDRNSAVVIRPPSSAPDPSRVEKEWKLLQEALVSTDWEMRLDAVEALGTMMNADATRGNAGMFSRALDELVRRMSDPHFRVCHRALRCFRALLDDTSLQATADNHLLLGAFLALLVGTTSRKAAVAGEAAKILVALLDVLEPPTSVSCLFQCLDDITTPPVRARALEAVQAVIDRQWEYFTDPGAVGSVLRALVHRLRSAEASVAAAGTRERDFVWGPAQEGIRTLHRRVPNALELAVAALDGDDQAVVQRLLEDRRDETNKLLCIRDGADAATPTERSSRSLPQPRGRSGVASPRRMSRGPGEGLAVFPAEAPERATATGTAAALCPTAPAQAPAPTHAEARLPLKAVMTSPAKAANPRLAHRLHRAPETNLFPTEFSANHFVDPNEPETASYPFPTPVDGGSSHSPISDARGRKMSAGAWRDAGGGGGRGGGGAGAAIASRTALVRERRRSFTAAAACASPGPEGEIPAGGAAAAATDDAEPKTLLEDLCATDSTGDDLCTALDSVCAALSQSRERWSGETCQELVIILLDRLCTEHVQPLHTVRWRAFTVLRMVLELAAMRPFVARHLARVLRVSRAGIDDAFFEVQQEASLVMHTVLQGCGLPVDLCLNGLTSVVEGWQRGPARDDCTRGWLEVLSELGRVFERTHAAQAVKTRSSDPNVMMTESVLHRVVRVVHWCADHCAAQVRRTSILVLVAMWLAMDRRAFPFLAPLTAAQRKLVSIYFNKAALARDGSCVDDVDRMLRDLLSMKKVATEATPAWRDLNAEMRAAGYPEPSGQ